jgi:hypothetical protein
VRVEAVEVLQDLICLLPLHSLSNDLLSTELHEWEGIFLRFLLAFDVLQICVLHLREVLHQVEVGKAARVVELLICNAAINEFCFQAHFVNLQAVTLEVISSAHKVIPSYLKLLIGFLNDIGGLVPSQFPNFLKQSLLDRGHIKLLDEGLSLNYGVN